MPKKEPSYLLRSDFLLMAYPRGKCGHANIYGNNTQSSDHDLSANNLSKALLSLSLQSPLWILSCLAHVYAVIFMCLTSVIRKRQSLKANCLKLWL